ncbi:MULTISPECIES: hypothetical protein [Haloarcula]|uniref:hypothetical protein n=1 Tax=Haloarcula TaxID=2237 RepID=UPI0023E7B614|nr:hypothetical protein [Halomicroarcula sp. SHR3]
MDVDKIGCDKKAIFLGQKKHLSCELHSPSRPDDDPYYLGDVDQVKIDEEVSVGLTGVSPTRSAWNFEETVDCTVEDHQIHCRLPAERQ